MRDGPGAVGPQQDRHGVCRDASDIPHVPNHPLQPKIHHESPDDAPEAQGCLRTGRSQHAGRQVAQFQGVASSSDPARLKISLEGSPDIRPFVWITARSSERRSFVGYRPRWNGTDASYQIVTPPSTYTLAPVTSRASREARNRTAPTMSSGSPTRFRGIRFRRSCRLASSWR
jgi:hypothetical protein